MTSIRRGALRRMIAVGVATAILLPSTGGAQEPDPERQRDKVRSQRAEIALEIDALEARDAEVRQALADLQANLTVQRAELAEAEEALASADAAVLAAEAEVADVERRIADLTVAAERLVAEAFVNPPVARALEALRAETASEAMVKQALIEMQADADADVLDLLDRAHADLEAEQARREELAALAAEKADDAEQQFADVEAALAQQRQFAADVEQRLNAKLAEAESLKQLDAALSAQIAAEQAKLAAQLRALQSRQPPASDPSPAVIAPAPGGLATVTCPGGGSITVAGSIAGNVGALLNAASADGVLLCGGGYRNPEQQIQLRIAHCGSSNYAIYYMPASQCNPPTARPGTSLHEQGLAIDFICNGGGTVGYGDECWNWLSAHASNYGLYNLPSEPWHWSTNGA